MVVRRFKGKVSPVIGSAALARASTTPGFNTRNVTRQMKAIREEYRRWTDHLEDVSGEVLVEALQPTFERSQELVPRRTGRLAASGYLVKQRAYGGDQVEIGYARDGDPNYAALVHEHVEFYHEPPTQAKYLQQPLEENASQIQASILAGLKHASGT